MKKMAVAVLVVSALGAFAAAHAADTTIYEQAVANPARSGADRKRDEREYPAEVMAFAGLQPGMKVADVFGGGGYYSELISYVVGTKGAVTLLNNPPYEDYAAKELKAHLAANRLPNVKHSVIDPKDLKLGQEQYDQVWIVLSYHDLFYADPENGWPAIDADNFVDQIYKALKPGGAFLIIDHAAPAGLGKGGAQFLHRIEESFARSDIERHGFEFAGHFDKLRNPDDKLEIEVFNAQVQHKTDRFVHLYRKPSKPASSS
jgi:predicted methyltransferase